MPAHIHGTSGRNRLPGDAAAGTIHAGAGGDLIHGEGLAGPHPLPYPEPGPAPMIHGDLILAGPGNDTVHAGCGADLVGPAAAAMCWRAASVPTR